MINVSDFDGVVAEMMAEFSGSATVSINITLPNDTSTGNVAVQKIDYDVKAIMLDLTTVRAGTTQLTGTLIQAGDKVVYVQPAEKAGGIAIPALNPAKDTFTMGNITYKIVYAQDLNPSCDNSILLQLYVRK